ncbi:MAG: hypothetical protein FWG87_13405 [Defluviitaleaceae bacterium]|nr:hypothetical protein [Defluviitaleaceae bacterium]
MLTPTRPTLINATLSHLTDGEKILWENHPCYQAFRATKIPAILFALPFTIVPAIVGVVIALSVALASDGLGSLMPLLLIIPFFGAFQIPMIMAIAQLVTARSAWQDTYYVVTNKRVLIQSAGIVRREIKSNLISELSGVFLKIDWIDKKYDTGTIKLIFNNLNFISVQGMTALNEIRHIDDAHDVFAKLQNMEISTRKENKNA